MNLLSLEVFLLGGLLVASTADAQSSLPECPADPQAPWLDCMGTVTPRSGDKYVGEFRDNRPGGQGTLTWANGNKYVGAFSDGKMNGHGTLTFANGSKYVGEFSDGIMNGQGTLTFADGSSYTGEFRNNQSNGHGTFTWANGSKYVGEFRDGKPANADSSSSPARSETEQNLDTPPGTRRQSD